MFAAWAVAAAAGRRRGEARGVVEAELAAGAGRGGLAAAGVLAFAVEASVAAAGAGAGFAAGVAGGGETVELRAIAAACALLALLAVSLYALSLLVAQLVPPHAAGAVAATVVVALFLVEGLSRMFPTLEPVAAVSPFHLYDASAPLANGGAIDLRSCLFLAAIAAVATACAVLVFGARDADRGGVPPALRFPWHRERRASAWLAAPVAREIYRARAGVALWVAGSVALAAVYVTVAKAAVRPFALIPALSPFPGSGRGGIVASVLALMWSDGAELLLLALAVAQTAGWAAEDADGRLEQTLARAGRPAIVLERLAAAAAVAGLVAVSGGVALDLAARIEGLALDAGRVAGASLLLVPFALCFAAAGLLAASTRPRAATWALGALAAATYLDAEAGPALGFPAWLQELSPFKLYGTPLASGAGARSVSIMLLLVVLIGGSSILALQRRDVRT